MFVVSSSLLRGVDVPDRTSSLKLLANLFECVPTANGSEYGFDVYLIECSLNDICVQVFPELIHFDISDCDGPAVD
eukprot:218115-Rhodomonas_salina.1